MTDYTTVANVKAQINKQKSDADTLLGELIPMAGELINDICHRPDGFIATAVAEPRIYAGSGRAYQWFNECIEVTKIEIKRSVTDTVWVELDADTYVLGSGSERRPNFNGPRYYFAISLPNSSFPIFPAGSIVGGLEGFEPLQKRLDSAVPTVRVTARWGYAETCPGPIAQATAIQVARWYKRGQGAWGDTLANSDMGQLQYLKRMDPDIENNIKNGRFISPMYKP